MRAAHRAARTRSLRLLTRCRTRSNAVIKRPLLGRLGDRIDNFPLTAWIVRMVFHTLAQIDLRNANSVVAAGSTLQICCAI